MVFNFKVCRISRGACKLVQIFILTKKIKKKLVRVVIFSLNDENIEMRFEKFTYQINKINKLLYVLINTRESLKINKN